jgi:betaine-aldehyde dehydrogenase
MSATRSVPSRATADGPVDRYVTGRTRRMLVGGELVEAASGHRLEVIDPSTGETVTDVPAADARDVDRAVAAAQAAQPGWEAMGLEGRAACFARLRALLLEHEEELAMLDAIDVGNPVRAMRIDVRICTAYLDAYPKMAYGLNGRVIPASRDGLHYTSGRPYGVVGRITAFNHPLMFAATRPLPALITGNAVVMKVAPQAPLSALALGELLADAFPPGVVNVLSGGAEGGVALVAHPAVKRLGFTGSVATGLTIQRQAAASGYVKHLSLELGGKNAMVVLPDVDVAAAVEGALDGMNLTVCQGQSCGSNSRILVHDAVHDEFVERLAARLEELNVLPAYSEESDMGPLVSAAHYERVSSYVARGRSEGARLVTGGKHPDAVPEDGYFLEPTLFTGVEPHMAIAQEEIFGPVISVLSWQDLESMLDVANGTELGLTASVWTHDLDLAHRLAARLDAGYVWINDSTTHYVGTPFGGTRNSGLGREECEEELWSYLETKVVHTRLQAAKDALARLDASVAGAPPSASVARPPSASVADRG